MSKMSCSEALGEAMKIRMRQDPRVIIFGEDVADMGGTYGVTQGFLEEFGSERVRDTPISESGFVGAAVGAAATGLRPIAELMMCDFLTVCMDPLVNQAAKMRYMFGGNISVPVVVRMASGVAYGSAAQHNQSLEAWVTHVPGLKVVYPSNPQDSLGLLLSAIDDDNPVVFFEHKQLYAKKGEVTSFEPIPLGKGRIDREGRDVSIITYAKQVYTAQEAAEILAREGIEAEIIDLDREKRRMTLSIKRLQQSSGRGNEATGNSGRIRHSEGGGGTSIGELLASKMGKDKLNDVIKTENSEEAK